MAKKCTKIYNTHAKLLLHRKNGRFGSGKAGHNFSVEYKRKQVAEINSDNACYNFKLELTHASTGNLNLLPKIPCSENRKP